jgi:YVTN family beta-propeller protein
VKLRIHAARRIAEGVITCTAVLLTAAPGVAGPAAAAGSPAVATRPTRPVIAYVVSLFSRVTPINTATGRVGKAIKVGNEPGAIAITPDGKTAFVANYGSGTVTPIRTATSKAGRAIKVGENPVAIGITPNGRTAYVINNVPPPPGGAV